MWNIYLKVTIETFSKLQFSWFKKFVTGSQKSSLVSGNPPDENIFITHPPAKKKKKKKKKNKYSKKSKEIKEEKRISPENRLKK